MQTTLKKLAAAKEFLNCDCYINVGKHFGYSPVRAMTVDLPKLQLSLYLIA